MIIKKTLSIGSIVIAFAAPGWAMNASSLLNKANQMNYQETETAKLAYDKAGDNQALMTYAETVKGDHEANEKAVSALSRQKSIKLEGTDSSKVDDGKLSDLKGGAFNRAYLSDQVAGHKDALRTFKDASREFTSDPDMELYIKQTIPVLQAHLQMAENLKNSLSEGSTENPTNNKSTSKDMGRTSER